MGEDTRGKGVASSLRARIRRPAGMSPDRRYSRVIAPTIPCVQICAKTAWCRVSTLATYALAERVVSTWRLFVPPVDVCLCGRFEIPELVRVLVLLADVRQEIAHALPDEQQLAAALIKQLCVQHTSREKRRHHLPVRGHHPKRRVLLAARRAQRREVFRRLGLERRREPCPRLTQALFAAQVVELQNQPHIIVGRSRDTAVHVSRPTWNRP